MLRGITQLCSWLATGAEAKVELGPRHQQQRSRFYDLQGRLHPGTWWLFFEPICPRQLHGEPLRTGRTSKPLRPVLEPTSHLPHIYDCDSKARSYAGYRWNILTS